MLPKKPAGLTNKLPSKVEKRLAQRLKMFQSKPAAKSLMHENVVARPMDKSLSKLLEIRRAQKSGTGTSVKRLKRGNEEEEERASSVIRLNESRGDEQEDEQATSVKRLGRNHLPLATLPANLLHPQPKNNQIGDLNA